ncbi:Uncharacterized protein HZ326_27835, partial [Fusarium oxysporum f. sp. albedinis]
MLLGGIRLKRVRYLAPESALVKGRNHYIHSTLDQVEWMYDFLGNYIVDVTHIRPEWNGSSLSEVDTNSSACCCCDVSSTSLTLSSP